MPPPGATPASLEVLLRQASAHRLAGRVTEGIDAYERALALRPDLPNSWYNLGWLRRRAGLPDAALQAYGEALRRGVADPEEVHLNRALIRSEDLHDPTGAADELQAALRLNPGYVPALLNLGNLHEELGDRPAAMAAYRRALENAPGHPLALARFASLHRPQDGGDPILRALREAIERPALDAQSRADLGFVLAGLLDQVGNYDAAIDSLHRAHAAARDAAATSPRFDAEAARRLIDSLIRRFDHPGAPPVRPRTEAAGHVFICGMYRSGSTLAERILGRHPAVTAGGELGLLPRLLERRPALIDGDLPPPDDALVAAAAGDYRREAAARFPGAKVLTDKRPDNFLWIGLIRRMLPDAAIVHTTRHPLDTCLSVYFVQFRASTPYAGQLADIAQWYGLYRRLMAHWERLHGDAIATVDYDRLVVSPKAVVEPLTRHCGLAWDAALLDFHDAPGAVRTASIWQVREPLYQRSSGRWRHYERHLAPLVEGLERAGVCL